MRFRNTLAWIYAAIVTITLFTAPFLHGATAPFWLALLQVVASLAGVVGIWTCWGKVRLLWLPLAVVLLGWIQVTPLPDSIVSVVSPVSAQAWEHAAQALQRPLPKTISVTPGETWAATYHLFLMTMIFVITGEISRDRRKAWLISSGLGLVGFLVLLWGVTEWIVQRDIIYTAPWMRWPFGYKNPTVAPWQTAAFGRVQMTAVGGISYSTPYWVVGDMFGPYLVSNHFAGCLELTLPVLLAVLLWLSSRMKSQSGSLRYVVASLVALLPVVAILVVGLGARSRAGTAGLLLGFVWVVWHGLPDRFRKLGCYVFAMTAIILFSLFVSSYCAKELLAFGHRVGMGLPLSALMGLVGGAEWRITQWLVCLRIFQASPWFGLGLGSYRVASPYYTSSEVRTAFAHSDFFQLLAESGLVGMLISTLLVILTVAMWLRQRKATLDQQTPLLMGLEGCLIGFLPHGLVDWNLHVPANGFLFAVVLGLFCGRLFPEQSAEKTSGRSQILLRYARVLAPGVTVVLCGLAMIEAVRQAQAETMITGLRQALLWNMWTKSGLSAEEREELLLASIPSAWRAVRMAPCNAEYSELLGRAYLHLSRGKRIPELRMAEECFSMSIAQSPLSLHLFPTLGEIRLALFSQERDGDSYQCHPPEEATKSMGGLTK